uniref:Armadillo repeat-containing domain-containing protein n=1 Tax=Periophthalmus magnuspinnatus TaxID=409849 RepID=A0A3B4BFI9_9GOBI
MGDSITPRFGNMKALLGIVAGAGASYGLYKLISSSSFRKSRKGTRNDSSNVSTVSLQPGSLLAKHLKTLLSCLQFSNSQDDKCRMLLTLANASAFVINQNLIREYEGIPIIAGFLSDPAADVRVQSLIALNNLSMNIENQEQLTVYVPKVLELIETSPMNSELQLCALRLLTNLSVTDKHQHLLKDSIKLLLSLFVLNISVFFQVQTLKVLVNLSSNPDMMDDIVQVQAPASVLLLFDPRTVPAVLVRLLTFAGNLKAWRPSAQVAAELRQNQDSLFRLMLDESSQLHSRVLPLLSHPEEEVRLQAARVLT